MIEAQHKISDGVSVTTNSELIIIWDDYLEDFVDLNIEEAMKLKVILDEWLEEQGVMGWKEDLYD